MGWKGTLRAISAAQRSIEREAVRRQRELERQQKQLAKMQEMERARYEVQVFDNYIDVISSVHKDCSDRWDWETLQKAGPPVEPQKTNKNEKQAIAAYKSYQPSFTDKLLGRVDSKREALKKTVIQSRKKDEKEYHNAIEDYKKQYSEWELIRGLATKILVGDIHAYVDAINQTETFGEINKIGSKVEFRISNRNLVEATLHVNNEQVIPKETKTLLASGKLSIKNMPKTSFFELYQDYVCGGVIRVARELFALLPIEIAIVTAVGELLNTKTGYMELQPILSVVFPRETLNRLNFEMIDPSDSMENFIHNMKFMKTKGFQPVNKLLPSDIKNA